MHHAGAPYWHDMGGSLTDRTGDGDGEPVGGVIRLTEVLEPSAGGVGKPDGLGEVDWGGCEPGRDG